MEIYKITNTITGLSYIGKTEVGFWSRYGINWNTSLSNPYLKNSVKKHGQDKFKVEILAYTNDPDHLCLLEQMYIKEHNTLFPNGFNLQPGGKKGKHIEDTKKRISAKMKEYFKENPRPSTKKERSECRICGKELFSYRCRGKLKVSCSKDCANKVIKESMAKTGRLNIKHGKYVKSRSREMTQ